MSNAIFELPVVYNEPVLSYAPGSPERETIKQTIQELKSALWDIPMVIDGKEVRTRDKRTIHPPHALHEALGTYSHGSARNVRDAIQAALKNCEVHTD